MATIPGGARPALQMRRVESSMRTRLPKLSEARTFSYEVGVAVVAGQLASRFASVDGCDTLRTRMEFFGTTPTAMIKDALLGLLFASDPKIVIHAMEACGIEKILEAVPFLARVVFGQKAFVDSGEKVELAAAEALIKIGREKVQRYDAEYRALLEFSRMPFPENAMVEDESHVRCMREKIQSIFVIG